MVATKPLLRVTATGPCTHVVEVELISKLREECPGEELCSPTFTVDGLDWMVFCKPDDEQGYMGVYVDLVTEGAVAWARVKIGLVDWTTGRADTFFPGDGDDDDPVLFDAGSDRCCTSGTGELASWEQQLRYLRRDCLCIECVIEVCRSYLVFPDPPPWHVEQQLGSHEGEDMLIKHAGDADAGGMTRQTVDALLRFIYTGTLPVVDGLSADGYRNLIAAERYDMRRLSAICHRVLCNSIDVECAAPMLLMAHRHGFQKIKKPCVEFASSDPDNCGSVHAKLIMFSETFPLAEEIWDKYCDNQQGLPSGRKLNGPWVHGTPVHPYTGSLKRGKRIYQTYEEGLLHQTNSCFACVNCGAEIAGGMCLSC